MRRAHHVLSLVLVHALLAAAPARAAWAPNGIPLCVAPGSQGASGAVSDGAGGAIVVFSDGQAFAQRVTFAGEIPPGWASNGNPLCIAPGRRVAPRAASDGAGGAFVAWEDDRTDAADIYAQHLLASGALDPAWGVAGVPIAVGPVVQYVVSIAPDGAGGCLIVWQDDRNAIGDPNLDIYAQRVSAAGVPLWTANGRAVCSAPGTQYLPKVVGDGVGGAYITWEDEASSVPRVYVHHLTAAGSAAPGWPANGIVLGNTGPLGAQYSPAIAADGEGGVLIAWSGSNNHVVFHSFVQRVGAAGAIAPGWLAAGTQLCNLLQTQDIPQVVSDRTGGAIVVWRDWRDITNPFINYDIYAQRVNATGVPQWTTNGVPVCTAPGSQDIPAAVGDDQGGVVVAWEDYRGGGGESDIYAQRLTPTGVRAPGWDTDGTALCALPGYQTGPVLVPDGLAGAIVAWSDSRPAPRFQAADIYAARTPDDIVVPVLASLVGASAQPDRVVLAWQIPGAAVSARVWRRAAGEAWAVIGSVASAGDGRLAFEDLDVRAGESYDYRLGLVQDDGEIFAGETRVTVPGFSAFALEGARPNPAADGLALAFTLPDGAPAVLEVLDIGGRVLEAHPVGELGAGRHVVQMSAGTPLRPGLYYARLRRAGRSLTARVAVIR